MTLQSMTGFARVEGSSGRYRWAWELRSVNGKGLDLRTRLPQGHEGLEADIRRLAGERLTRGNIQIGLSVTVSENKVEAVLNRDALAAVLALRDELGPEVLDPAPLKLDTLLSIRGLVDMREATDDADAIAARDADILGGLERAISALADMRTTEGAALRRILEDHIHRIEDSPADRGRSLALSGRNRPPAGGAARGPDGHDIRPRPRPPASGNRADCHQGRFA